MNTWTAELPPDLPPPTLAGKMIGAIRLVSLVLVTLVSVGLFLVGRGLRSLLGRWITFHFGVAWIWARLCLGLTGLRLKISGKPIAAGALVANHSSWIDILSLRSACLMYFVSKAEVANWPGVGFLTRITGTVFIERKRTEAKRQEAVLRERIAAEQLLCFFPEGTSTDGLRVLPFKSSLFSALFNEGTGTEILLQPVSLHYRLCEGSVLPASFYGWWGEMGFEAHIWDVMTRSFGGVVEVVFHPAVPASAFDDRKQLADHCQRIVDLGHQKGVPVTLDPVETRAIGSGEQDG